MKIIFEASPGGDGECFCWKDVSKEDMIAVMGEAAYQNELKWQFYFDNEQQIRNDNPDLSFDEVEQLAETQQLSDELKQLAISKVSNLHMTDILRGMLGDYDGKRLKVTIEVEELHDPSNCLG